MELNEWRSTVQVGDTVGVYQNSTPKITKIKVINPEVPCCIGLESPPTAHFPTFWVKRSSLFYISTDFKAEVLRHEKLEALQDALLNPKVTLEQLQRMLDIAKETT